MFDKFKVHAKEDVPEWRSKILQSLNQYGRILPQWLFPRLEEELGPLTEKQEQLVTVLELLEMEVTLPSGGPIVSKAASESGYWQTS